MKKHLYQIIVSDIKKQIISGDFSYNTPICTEKILCKKYAVSRITAIKALDELCKKGFIYKKRGVGCFVLKKDIPNSNLNLSSEISNSRNTIALLMPYQVGDGSIFYIIEELSKILTENSMNLCVFSSERDSNLERETLKNLCNENISALIYYPEDDIAYDELYYFIGNNIPVLVLDKPITTRTIHNICSNNASGQYELTKLLTDKGHKKIAYLHSKSLIIPSVQDRILGYMSCLADSKIAYREDFLVTSSINNKEKMKRLVSELFAKGVTAIQCNNDETAFAVFQACQSLNISVPNQLALTGFDNLHWSNLMGLSLTTTKQDFEKIGKLIGEIIIKELNGQNPEKKQYQIPTILIERSSTDVIIT